jgi:hypothetical protein
VVAEVLEQCWSRWSLAAEESRQREREEQSLYKYRQKTHVIEEEEGEVSEAEVERFFPTYEFMEEGEDGEEKSCDQTTGSCDAEEVGKVREPVTEFSSDELQSIASLHLSLYNPGTSISAGRASALSAAMSYDLAGSIAKSIDVIPGKNWLNSKEL